MSGCCKGRLQKGQARYQLAPHAAPPAPGGTLATRTAYLLKQCLESLLRARMRRVDARALLAVFPHHWEDGTQVCLVYHTDSDGDFGAFRMVLQGDGQPALQCTTCNAVVGGVGGAESHVFTGKPTNNAKKYLYVYSVQLSLAALTDRINDGLLQAHDLVWRAQHAPQVVEVLGMPRGPPQLVGGASGLAAYGAANPAALAVLAGGGGGGGAAGAAAAAVPEDAAEALMLLGQDAGRALIADQEAMDAAGEADQGMQEARPAGEEQGQQQQEQEQHTRASRIPLQQLDIPQGQAGQHQAQQQQQQQVPGSQQQQQQQQQQPPREQALQLVKKEPTTDARQHQQQQQQQQQAPAGAAGVQGGAAGTAGAHTAGAAEAPASPKKAPGAKLVAEASAAAGSPGSAGRKVGSGRHGYRSGSTVMREVGPGAGPRANAAGGVVAPGVGGGFKAAPPEQQAAAAAALGRSLGVVVQELAVQQAPLSTPLPGLPVIAGAPGAVGGVKRGHEATVSSTTTTSSASAMTSAPRFLIVNAEGVVTAVAGPALAALQKGLATAAPSSVVGTAAAGAAEGAAEAPPAKKAKAEQQQQGALPGLPIFATPTGSTLSKQEPMQGSTGPQTLPPTSAADSSRSTQVRFSTGSMQPPAPHGPLDSSSVGGASDPHHQQQQEQDVDEQTYHQMTSRAVNLAEQPEGGLEAYVLVCDLLVVPDPAERQVGLDLLRLLQAADPKQLARWNLAAMVKVLDIDVDEQGVDCSVLGRLRDVLLALRRMEADTKAGQQQQQPKQQQGQMAAEGDQAAADIQAKLDAAATLFVGACEHLLALFLQPSQILRGTGVDVIVWHQIDDAACFLQEARSPAIPPQVQAALLGVAAAAMQCIAGALLSPTEPCSVRDDTLRQLSFVLRRLKQGQQVEVLGCERLWLQLATCLAQAGPDTRLVQLCCTAFVRLCDFDKPSSCLAPGMLAAQPGYAEALLRVIVKQGRLMMQLRSSSRSGQQQGAPAKLDPLVVQEMQLCGSLAEALLGSEGSRGQVQQLASAYAQAPVNSTSAEQAALQAAVGCMSPRLQLVEAALDVVLQLPEADLLAHIKKAAASGVPAAVGLVARVVEATAGEKRPEVVAACMRMPRSNCERLLGVRRQSGAAQ